jgi:putative transcriptional regulator
MNRYHYTQSGLDNVWLENGFTFDQTPYGRGVIIENVHGLHEAIGYALLDKPGRLTGRELRFLRKELELSQSRLGELMGKTDQTVARWEKAQEVLPDTDFLVRHIYRQTVVSACASYVEMVDYLKEKGLELYNGEFSFQETEEGWKKAAAA